MADCYWSKKNVNKKDIDKAVERIISSQSDFYLELYDKLSKYQKKVLLAVAESGIGIYSKSYADKFGLSSISSTQRAVKKLLDVGIIEKEKKYMLFSDPFFKNYLQKQFKV